MKKLVTLILAIGMTHITFAQENVRPPDVAEAKKAPNTDPKHKEAVDILKKVDEATKAIKVVSYKSSTLGTGWAATRTPKLEAKVIAAGKWDGELGKFRAEAKVTMPDSSETREFSGGNTGEEYYLVDPTKKLVYADLDPAVMGSDGRLLTMGFMQEFNHPTPFTDEVNSEMAEIKGSEKIGEEECVIINVIYRPNLEAVWYFSKKDNLPRRVDRVVKSPTGEAGTRQTIVTELVVEPKAAEDAFKLTVPEGFTKTDEFAPMRPRPGM